MTTRRELLASIPATGAAFAVGGVLFDESMALAQEAPAPLATHFHPKGKAPSTHTIEALKRSSANLPFADARDFEELKNDLGVRSQHRAGRDAEEKAVTDLSCCAGDGDSYWVCHGLTR